jgi:ABC-type nitrate/sulfonate/bicarbonate transport system substrate-binding protein
MEGAFMERKGPFEAMGFAAIKGANRWGLLVLTLLVPVFVAAEDDRAPRLLGVQYLGDFPTLVADEHGYFRGTAADLRVKYTTSGRENLRRLRAGEADIALMAKTPLVIDALRDASPGAAEDPVILGNLVHSHRLNQVVSLKAGSVEAPGDLEGRRVGLMKGTNAEFVWSLVARMHGVDASRVDVLDMPVGKLPAALSGDRIDAAVLWEPWTSRTAEAAGGLRILPGSSAYTAHWVIVARRSWVRAHPALVRDLLRGYIRAINWIDQHRDRALGLYVQRMEVARSRVERSWAVLDYDLSLDWTVLNGLRLQLQWARDAGYARMDAPAPGVLRLVEPSPLRRLAPHRVSIPGPVGREDSP